MLAKIEAIKKEALQRLDGIDNTKDMEAWRVHYLGKKSPLTQILRSLGTLPVEERKAMGAAANRLKTLLENNAVQKGQALRESELSRVARGEAFDFSLPGRPYPVGRLHPITQTINEVSEIFLSMGFKILEGPDVEWDYYNFEALNMPAEHPARDSFSTFWIDYETEDGNRPVLLSTHTTSITARTLENMEPPIRAIEPGTVYRYEATDSTHLAMFHHIDGIAVDKGITMADLKGTLYEFARRYFGTDRKVRFRVDYFPFVEPGVEMAIDCIACRGQGCRICGNSGWLEILGAGMTHPDVLRRGSIDPKVYSSFAFGMGVERLPMLRYGIEDMRLFYNNDLRFLRQF